MFVVRDAELENMFAEPVIGVLRKLLCPSAGLVCPNAGVVFCANKELVWLNAGVVFCAYEGFEPNSGDD